MSGQTFLCGLLALGFLWMAAMCLREGEGGWAVALTLVTGLFASCSYQGTTPEHQAEIAAERKAEAERAAADRRPRLYSAGPDGCQVYTFKAGDRWHYFTRCPESKVTTESSYTVRSGKTTRTETESITTNP